MLTNKTLIVIVAPTAIGKTAISIDVAKHFETEILSSDSRQFYKEMKIGTAVPNETELSTVQHHFIQHLSIHDFYSVGNFEKDGINFIENFFQSKDILVMVGGSGLYEKAVTQGLDEFPEVDAQIRINLNDELKQFGLEQLQKELKEKDLEYFMNTDIENPHRLIRALEIIRGTGQTFSSFLTQSRKKRKFNIIKIGLELERIEIYNRINLRVDEMMKLGLLDEVKNLFEFRNVNALKTVGYSELFKVIEEEWDLRFAIDQIKKNTRRFAKRQMTWYRKDTEINWFRPSEKEEIIQFIEEKIPLSSD